MDIMLLRPTSKLMRKTVFIILSFLLTGCSNNVVFKNFFPKSIESITINNFENQNIVLKNELKDDFISTFSKLPLYQYEGIEQYEAVGQSELTVFLNDIKFVENGYVLFIDDEGYCYKKQDQEYNGGTIYTYCKQLIYNLSPYTIYDDSLPATYLTIYSYEDNKLTVSCNEEELFVYSYNNLLDFKSPLLNFDKLGLKAYENNVEVNELPNDKGIHKIFFIKDNISYILIYEC